MGSRAGASGGERACRAAECAVSVARAAAVQRVWVEDVRRTLPLDGGWGRADVAAVPLPVAGQGRVSRGVPDIGGECRSARRGGVEAAVGDADGSRAAARIVRGAAARAGG